MSKYLIALSDTHFTHKKPAKRVDDYVNVQLGKFEQVLISCEENDAALLVAGDIFETATEPYSLVAMYISMISEYDVPIYVVPGQHDVRFHSKKYDNTPFNIFLASDCTRILKDKPVKYGKWNLYGSGWETEIPVPKTKNNILVCHRMVIEDDLLFPGQDSHQYALGLLKRNPKYDFIVSGDNHRSHLVESNGRFNINCGSLMRSSKSQKEHRPSYYLLDLDKKTVERFFIDVEPFEEVFNLEEIEKEKRKKETKNFKGLLELMETSTNRPDFKVILKEVMKKAEVNKNVIEIINETIEKFEEE